MKQKKRVNLRYQSNHKNIRHFDTTNANHTIYVLMYYIFLSKRKKENENERKLLGKRWKVKVDVCTQI